MAALAVAAGLTLTGCDVTGTVDIGNDAIAIDLAIVSRSAGDGDRCRLPFESVITEHVALPDGRHLCRVSGTSPRTSGRGDDDGWAHEIASWAGDHVLVRIPPLTTDEDGGLEFVDVRITTPGPVLAVDPGAIPLGRTIRITDAETFRTKGLMLIASQHAGISPRAVGLILGAIAGIGAGTAGVWWWRRREAAPQSAADPPRDAGDGGPS